MAAHRALLSQISHAPAVTFVWASPKQKGGQAGGSVRRRGHRTIMGPGEEAMGNLLCLTPKSK